MTLKHYIPLQIHSLTPPSTPSPSQPTPAPPPTGPYLGWEHEQPSHLPMQSCSAPSSTLPALLSKAQTSQFSLSVFHHPFSPQLPKWPSSLPRPSTPYHGQSYLSKHILIWLSLPLIRTFDRPQLSRGWSLNSLARHSRPRTVHSEPVFQPIPHHSPISTPNSSPTARSQQSAPPPAPSPLPENFSSHPSPVYLVNSSATSPMVPFSPSIPPLLDLTIPLLLLL